MERQELLRAITYCPEIPKARADANHRCHEIVCFQWADAFQAPEPWRGHIDTALILFVSSNPGFRKGPAFPPADWATERIAEYYEGEFAKVVASAGNQVPFWSAIHSIAAAIYGHEVVAGKDYALTEIVHCKSTGEKGVNKAQPFCPNKWLDLVMEQSGAKIIVLLGRHARDHCAARWRLNKSERVKFGVPVAGRERAIVILPHPNAREERKVEVLVTPEQLRRLQELLPDAERGEIEVDGGFSVL